MFGFGFRLTIEMLLRRGHKTANAQLELERLFDKRALKQLHPSDLRTLQLEWRWGQPDTS